MSRVHVIRRESDDHPPEVAGWFEPDNATMFEQKRPPRSRRFGAGRLSGDGGHHSCPQRLFKTSDARWVRAIEFGEESGLGVEHRFITSAEASLWLQENGHADAVDSVDSAAERGPGRPEIGGLVQVRLGDILVSVDQFAAARDMKRADAIRELLRVGLAADT